MSKQFWNAMVANPAILGAYFFIANGALAAPPLPEETTFEQETPTPSVELTANSDAQLSSRSLEESPLSEEKFEPFYSPLNSANTSLSQVLPADESTPPDSTSTLEQINFYSTGEQVSDTDDSMQQVTNVSQLRDVSPGDWAYEALRSLVERYGCIAGYPDGTFRGNRATSRYEFAAGLNACLNQIERLMAGGTQVTREEFETLQRLVQEFQTELTTLGTRLDNLEGRVAFLEDHQFSATVKLTGSADFGLIDAWGDKRAVPSGQRPTQDLDANTFFPGRVALNFDTSFFGEDLLRVKLEAGNFTPLDASVTGTDMTLYDFDTRTGPTGNDIVLGSLLYRFPVGDRVAVFLAPQGLGSSDIAPQLNPVVGPISRFGQRNPIYRLSDGAGVGVNVRFTDAITGSFTYLGSPGNFSNPDVGVFNGQFGALAQLTFSPGDRFGVAFTYVRYYSPEPGEGINVTGNTGSGFSQTPFGDDAATSANAYGIEANFRVSPRFAIGGWVGVTEAQAQSNGIIANKGDEAEIWNYAVAVAFPDLGKEGNSLGLIFGMPPRIRGNDVASRRDADTSYRVEAFYRYKLTDNIAITPGAFAIFNPEHNDANDTIVVGTLLATFSF